MVSQHVLGALEPTRRLCDLLAGLINSACCELMVMIYYGEKIQNKINKVRQSTVLRKSGTNQPFSSGVKHS